MSDPTQTPNPTPESNVPANTPEAPASGDATANPESAPAPSGETAAGSAPTSYEFTAAQGTPDPKLVESVTATAKELGLSKEAAQKLFDSHVAQATAHRTAAQKAMSDAYAEWKAAAEADAEIGGANAQTTQVDVQAALKSSLATPALVNVLQASGFIGHPEIVRLLARVGKAMREDTPLSGKTPAPAPKKRTPEQIFYGAPEGKG